MNFLLIKKDLEIFLKILNYSYFKPLTGSNLEALLLEKLKQ